MTVKQVAFEKVFTGGVSYGPEAIVKFPLKELASNFHLHLDYGEDGLDKFEVIPMELLIADVKPVQFALWRHDGNPPNTFAIHLPVGADNEQSLSLIMEALHISPDWLIWKDPRQQP